MRVNCLLLVLVLCFCCRSAVASPPVSDRVLRLKAVTGKVAGKAAGSRSRSLNPGYSHQLLQPSSETPADWKEWLVRAGGNILMPVPDAAYLAVVPDSADLSQLHLALRTPLPPAAKWSRELQKEQSETTSFFLVELHPDVEREVAETIILGLHLMLVEHPDLLPHQLLVEGKLQDTQRLVEWDEIAYVFPASEELIRGLPVRACYGAFTEIGSVGQYVASVGDGWDGPGLGTAELTYTLSQLTAKMKPEEAVTIIQAALAEWERHADVKFRQGTDPLAEKNINVIFAQRAHGDTFAFDGVGGSLGHTFYPSLPNPEPIAGDLHLDEDESWGESRDLYSVVLHELGHALGLAHSDIPGTVMYPYYRKISRLHSEDVEAVRALYAPALNAPQPLRLAVDAAAPTSAAFLNLSGSASGGNGKLVVGWRSPSGQSGLGYSTEADGWGRWTAQSLPLQLGTNSFLFSVTDADGAKATQEITAIRQPEQNRAAQIAINQSRIEGDGLLLAGTASHASGISRVWWSSDRSGAGEASGSPNWTATVPLKPGDNLITIHASSFTGETASTSIQAVGSQQTVTSDKTAPALAITSPTGSTFTTSSATIRVTGTARDASGIAEITWTTSTGGSGTAVGTTSWEIAGVPLLLGTNTLNVRAADRAGNVSRRSVIITRR